MTEKKTPGRKRSHRSHQAILEATAALLGEGGYADLTIEAVAARAGVGKQTIYRWWPGKAALVMEAYADVAAREVPTPDTGSVRADLCQLVGRAFSVLGDTGAGKALAGLLSEAQSDPELARTFRTDFIEGRREAVRCILLRGIRRGELRPDLEVELVVDSLYGPMWYRLLVGHAPLSRSLAVELVDLLLRGAACGGD